MMERPNYGEAYHDDYEEQYEADHLEDHEGEYNSRYHEDGDFDLEDFLEKLEGQTEHQADYAADNSAQVDFGAQFGWRSKAATGGRGIGSHRTPGGPWLRCSSHLQTFRGRRRLPTNRAPMLRKRTSDSAEQKRLPENEPFCCGSVRT